MILRDSALFSISPLISVNTFLVINQYPVYKKPTGFDYPIDEITVIGSANAQLGIYVCYRYEIYRKIDSLVV